MSATDAPEIKQLFKAGKYDEAAKLLLSHPETTPAYYYNLGTIEYRRDQLGPAVAYLEKANRLQPHDAAIQSNLRAARLKLGHLIGEDHLDPASTSFEAFADTVPIAEIRGGIGLLCLVLTLFWIRSYLKTRSLTQTLFKPVGFLGILALGVVLALYGAERVAASHPPAVVIDRQTVRSGPGDRFLELSQVESGSKLRLMGPSEKAEGTGEPWLQVRFSADGIGWVRASSLLLL
jgi:tetratricopeptide (TPR) repeat protein